MIADKNEDPKHNAVEKTEKNDVFTFVLPFGKNPSYVSMILY